MWRRVRMVWIGLLSFLLFGTASGGSARAATVSLLCGVTSSWSFESCRAAAGRFEAESGHQVQLIKPEPSNDDTFRLITELFSVRSGAIDVVQLDIIWAGVLADHLQDLGAPGRDLAAQQMTAVRRAGTHAGKVLALPIYVDVGVLFYRRDLLEAHALGPPQKFSELRRAAGRVLGAEREAGRTLDGYLFQGKAYEGLTCNALEWMEGVGTQPIVEEGRVTVNAPGLKAMLSQAAGWIGETAPRSNLEAAETETFDRFAEGRALFMRNWASYANRLQREAPEVARSTGIVPLPSTPQGRRTGTLGGWMVGVTAYSREPEAARELALHLASTEEQRARALEDGLMPAAQILQADHELAKALPGLSAGSSLIGQAIVRPAKELGPAYLVVSREFASTVHAILAGDVAADEGLDALQRRFDRMSGGGQRWSH